MQAEKNSPCAARHQRTLASLIDLVGSVLHRNVPVPVPSKPVSFHKGTHRCNWNSSSWSGDVMRRFHAKGLIETLVPVIDVIPELKSAPFIDPGREIKEMDI